MQSYAVEDTCLINSSKFEALNRNTCRTKNSSKLTPFQTELTL